MRKVDMKACSTGAGRSAEYASVSGRHRDTNYDAQRASEASTYCDGKDDGILFEFDVLASRSSLR